MSWIDELLDAVQDDGGATRDADAIGRYELPADVELVPDVITLTGLELEVVSGHGEPVNAELRAKSFVGGTRVDAFVSLPSLVYSLAADATTWRLVDVLEQLGLDGLGLDRLTVSDVSLSGSMRTGLLRANLAFDSAQTWQPGRAGGAQLALDGLHIEVGLMGVGGSGYAAVEASGHVGSLDATVTGSYTASDSGSGWALSFGLRSVDISALFTELGWDVGAPGSLTIDSLLMSVTTWNEEGSAGDDTEVEVSASVGTSSALPLGDVLADLAGAFGATGLHPPDFFAEVSATSIDLTFLLDDAGDVVLDARCAGSLGFRYDGSADRPIPEVVVYVRIARSESGVEAEFGGRMTIGGDDPVELTLDVVSGDDGTSVVGLYRPDDGRLLDLGRLAPPELGLPSLDVPVAVEQLVFAWQKDPDGSSRYLLSLAIAATDFNADVPIVGKLFPDPGLSLGLTITAASARFADLTAVHDVLAEREEPAATVGGDRLAAGLNLTADVDLGSFVQPLEFAPSPESPDRPVRNDGSAASGDTNWTEIQRSFGPVHVARAGVGFADSELTVRLDASVRLGGLTISLHGLTVRTPIADIAPVLDLAGLGVELRSGAVEVSGAFVRLDSEWGTEFVGSAMIRAKAFTVQAVGALSEVDREICLFVFAAVNKAFGGPAAFFVTGIAGGFGYNRDFILPPLADVADHPFLAALGPGADQPAAADALAALADGVPPRLGSYWAAAGLTFESFKLVRSSAVVLVRLGGEVEILLLGRSRLTLPREARTPYVSLDLALRAAIRPAAGEILAEGMLTDASYVIDPTTTIRGGFAFALWFGDSPHRGDFVLTIGGYHPALRPPPHYPLADRLEIGWLDGPIAIGGWAYFALTPSCVMVGGQLEATYRDGAAFASFTMSAHFLIRWRPFAYDVRVGVSIYAAFTLDTLFGPMVLDARISADVHLWGPEFAGIATVSCGAFSFDVEFGAIESGPPSRARLSWPDFRDAYLPGDDDVCSIQISSGLVGQDPPADQVQDDEPVTWIVNGDALVLATSSVIPSSEVRLRRTDDLDRDGVPLAHAYSTVTGRGPDARLGVHPMANSGPLRSVQTISLRRTEEGSSEVIDLGSDRWRYDALSRQNVPAALWSDTVPAAEPPPSADVLPLRPVGLNGLQPVARVSADNPDPVDLAALPLGSDVDDPTDPAHGVLHLGGPVAAETAASPPADPPADGDDTETDEVPLVFREMATHLPVEGPRQAVIDTCLALGLLDGAPLDPVNPTMLATSPGDLLAAAPMLGDGTLGGPVTVAVDGAAPRDVARPDVSPPEGARDIAVALLAEVSNRTGQAVRAAAVAPPQEELTAETLGPVVETAPDGAQLTRILMSSADPQPAPPLERAVAQGTTTLFEITRTGEEHELPPDVVAPAVRLDVDSSAGVESRVVMLDRYGGLLSDRVRAGSVILDDRVAVVAVSARPSASAAAPIHGWRGPSSVLQVGPRTFLVDGGTMVTEVEHAGGVAARRAITAISDNVRPDDGRSGWVRTTLPAEVRTLAVFVRRSASAPAAAGSSVEIVQADGTKRRLHRDYLVHEGPSEVAMLFRVPVDAIATPSEIVVEVSIGGHRGWALNGVVGWDAPVDDIRRDWDPGRQSRLTAEVATGRTSMIRIEEAA